MHGTAKAEEYRRFVDDRNQPDWNNSEQWNEFQWEQALKYSDHSAARYFRMLDRFGDLPDAEELIAASLGDLGFFEFDDEFSEDWTEEDEFGDGAETEGSDEGSDPIVPGDAMFFEASPLYKRARQISLGWCNIEASVLAKEDHMWGLIILLHLGRLLSYLSLSIGDGTFVRAVANIAFGKRSLSQINTILGELQTKSQECPKYAGMFNLVSEHLLETHDMLILHVEECRRHNEDDEVA
ncbi:MAG TPA: hypothetical protein DIT01_08025 [Lentisphaeria bacterium]|nr:hypothetical protein [Lentisphaeria bacterium]|tara:strand:- start:2976 stop:3692 length:717 start_codon:yes stop_codon:yes gene_type:complete